MRIVLVAPFSAALLLHGRGEQRDEPMPSMPLAGVEYRF